MLFRSWLAHWAKQESKAKSQAYSANRRAAPDGQDCPVKHTGGSRSTAKHKLVLV